MGKRAFGVVTTILVALVALFAASLLAFKAMGGGAYAVLSGSMEPTYPVGSLLYVAPADPAQLHAGDVITYAVADNMVVTHRIASIHEGADNTGNANNANGANNAGNANTSSELWFTTKGDANEVVDASPVHANNIIGTPVLSIPVLGYAITYIKEPQGLYIALVVVGLLILASILPALRGKKQPAQAAGLHQA